MKQEDKDLLLKELCARLPYGVKVRCDFGLDGEITEISRTKNNLYYCKYLECKEGYCYIESLKPYLFPLSSMTSEQLHEIQSILGDDCKIENDFIRIVNSERNTLSYQEIKAVFNYCYKNHLDINGLIPMGLAIDATGLNVY